MKYCGKNIMTAKILHLFKEFEMNTNFSKLHLALPKKYSSLFFFKWLNRKLLIVISGCSSKAIKYMHLMSKLLHILLKIEVINFVMGQFSIMLSFWSWQHYSLKRQYYLLKRESKHGSGSCAILPFNRVITCNFDINKNNTYCGLHEAIMC